MLKTFSKGLGLGAVGLLAALAFAGCVDLPPDNTPATQQPTTQMDANSFTVGGILPLTGDGATYGEPMQKIAQIALDEINAAGGINGKKMNIVWEDGKCNGNDGAAAANKLINVDKVKVIYGGFCSSETLAVAPLAEAAHVVVLSPGSSSPDITNAGDYIFRNYPSDATQGKVLAQGAQEKGFKKVGILAEQNDYTLGIQKVFTSEFEKLGGKVEVENYLPDNSDFRTSLLKLKTAGVDALLVDPQTPAKADLIFKQLDEMKWNVKLMGNDVVAGYQDLLTKYSKLVEGMVVAEFTYDKTNPAFVKLAATYKKMTGKELPYGTYASTCYDAVYIIKEALAAVGNDADAIKGYLNAIKDRKGLGGTLNFDANGDPKAGHSLEVVKGGKVVPYVK